jgi:hypothetical protein
MQAQSLQAQAQTQTFQGLQEQYGNVMAALLPHATFSAIPYSPHRYSLTETLFKITPAQAEVTAPLTTKHSRSTSYTAVPSSHNLLPRKKRRLENDESESHAPLHRRPTTLIHSPRFRTPLTTVSPLAKSTNTKNLTLLAVHLAIYHYLNGISMHFSRHLSRKTFQGSRHTTPSITADAGQLPCIRHLHTSISELTKSSLSTPELKENVVSNRSCSPPERHSRI